MTNETFKVYAVYFNTQRGIDEASAYVRASSIANAIKQGAEQAGVALEAPFEGALVWHVTGVYVATGWETAELAESPAPAKAAFVFKDGRGDTQIRYS